MVEIVLNEIEIGAQYGDAIFDYWLFASLNNNQSIQIFDLKPLDLREYKGQHIFCLLELYGIQQVEDESLKMEYLGVNNQISFGTQNIEPGVYHEFRDTTGIYYAKEDELTNIKLENGKYYSFKIDRFDLIAFNLK